MKKPITILIAAAITLFIATSALPLSVGAGIRADTDDNLYGGRAEDTKVPQPAPLNPDFVAYMKNPSKASFGDIPPPMDLSHLDKLPVENLPTSDKLPSSFDWRDYGKVTSVKDQDPCGTCWDFAATSTLESAVLMNESVAYNFSEQSVALCVDHSWTYLYDNSTDPCLAGGNCWLASEVFIRKGSVPESCNPYDGSALNCDGSCVCDDCPPVKKVDGFRVAAWNGSQIDTIKNAIYNNGPAKLSYFHNWDYEYWDTTWGAIYDYFPCIEGTNHAVTIVGWNDDVPHPNPSHTGTGAWIIKNSWGTAVPWAAGAGISDGYFYLAYDSSCVERIIYLGYKNPLPGEELLYWDEAGQVGDVGYEDSSSAWMASVFTANNSVDLTHVDFWTTSNNAQYKIYVWDGYFGAELAHQTGNCQEAGYYSIPLNASISIGAGQQFTVGVKMTTPGYCYPIPVEYEISGTVDPPIQSGVSFIRHTASNSWTDLANYDWNACLRARVKEEEKKPDLVITEKWVCWPDNCTICYNVTNIGNGTAPAGHNTMLFVDGLEVVYDPVPVALASGDGYIGCFNYVWTYTPPSDNITVCADFNDTVSESNETNNCLKETCKCGDVDMDGNVDFLGDVRGVARYYMNGEPIKCPWAGDVDCDGDIDFLGDAMGIARHYMHGEALDCCCD